MKAIQLSLLLKDKTITQIYTGRESGCRCGCHGRYFERGTKGFTRAFNKAKDLDPIVSVFDGPDAKAVCDALSEQERTQYDGTVTAVANDVWLDICTGNGKTITLYFK